MADPACCWAAPTRPTCPRRRRPPGARRGRAPGASSPTRSTPRLAAAFALGGRLFVAELLSATAASSWWPARRSIPGPPRRPARRLRERELRVGRARRAQPAAGRPGGRGRRPGRHLGLGRVRRGRGDGPQPGLLVVARRRIAGGRPGRHLAGPALVGRRPRQPGARRPSSPTRRPGPPTPTSRSTSSTRRLPAPRSAGTAQRSRTWPPSLARPGPAARDRAVPRPAPPAGAGRRSRHRRHRGAR